MWLTLTVALSAAGPRPPLALRGGGAPESELLDSLNTAKLRLHALEHRLKTSLDARASDTEASPDRVEGLEPVLAEPEAGDRVRVRRDVATPRYEWGEGVDHASVGRLTWFSGSRCTVDFPRHPGWNGLLDEMERVAPGRGLARVGERVRVRSDLTRPSYGWGPVVEHGAVGEVVSLGYDTEASDREICVVRFEGHANWTGVLKEMELVEPRAEGKHAAGRAAEPRTAAAAAAAAAAAGRLPFDERPGSFASSAASSHYDGAEARRRGERPMALRAGWVLGATALAITAQGGSTNAKEGEYPEEGSASTRATTARGAKRGQVLRQLGGAMALLLAFFWSLGALLALGAALLDKPVHSLLDEALETALRLRRGLLRRPHPPLVDAQGLGPMGLGRDSYLGRAGGVSAGALPPLLRASLLLPLRMPTVFFSALLLNLFCVRGAVPATLEEVRRGFELGFRQLRGANAAAASAQLLARQERLLRLVSTYLRAAAGVTRAARATAIGIGALVLLGNYFD